MVSSSVFVVGSVWCYHDKYTFVILHDDRMLCLCDEIGGAKDDGKTFRLDSGFFSVSVRIA